MAKVVPEQHIERPYLEDLKELIEFVGENYKNKTSIHYNEDDEYKVVTFADLRADVEGLEGYLFKNGIKGGKRVALLGENSYEWIVGYFATVNCGNIVVPIDKELKVNEIANLLNDSESAILFYSKAKEKIAEELKALCPATEKFVCFDEFKTVLAEGKEFVKEDDECLKVEINREEMCAIIYTSGTTGDPKA